MLPDLESLPCQRQGDSRVKKRVPILFLTIPTSGLYSQNLVQRGASSRDVATMGRDAVLAGGKDVFPPPSGPWSKRCGELGPVSSGHRETRKRTDTAVARRVARRITYRCVGPKGQGSLPNQKPGGSASNPDHASSRRAIPLARGGKKRRATRARQRTGSDFTRLSGNQLFAIRELPD